MQNMHLAEILARPSAEQNFSKVLITSIIYSYEVDWFALFELLC
jgi:hypothetical protein